MRGLRRLLVAASMLAAFSPPAAWAQNKSFNSYVLDAVELLATSHANGGYDINARYSRDLPYGPEATVPGGPRRPKTMCVSAVGEVLLTALDLYWRATGDASAFENVDANHWTRGTQNSLRAHLFMFAGTNSRGSAHALATFRMGEETSFDRLMPGDVLNFNRYGGSGHAVIFLGYIGANGEVTTRYAPSVIGFRYFSSQGGDRPDAGFGYRWAYFRDPGADHCPAVRNPDRLRDCGIIRRMDSRFLNSGRVWHPGDWRANEARDAINARVRTEIDAELPPTRSAAEFQAEVTLRLETELQPGNLQRFSGDTLD